MHINNKVLDRYENTLRTQTLSTISFTAYGGRFITLTTAISVVVKVSRAA